VVRHVLRLPNAAYHRKALELRQLTPQYDTLRAVKPLRMPPKGLQRDCRTIVLCERGKLVRPRLDPAMGEIPICARVAIQMCYRAYLNPTLGDFDPPDLARLVALNLPADYPGMLKFALHSLGVYLDLGWTSLQWLTAVLEASHLSHNFRRCFFFAYKDNRSPYPRVTNRGVQNSRKGRKSTLRKA
jgi:hypothetical protein